MHGAFPLDVDELVGRVVRGLVVEDLASDGLGGVPAAAAGGVVLPEGLERDTQK